MIRNEEDVKYKEIISTLKSLQKVKAPAGFETELMRNINTGNYTEKKTFWENILAPSRLIPSSAAALAMVAVLLFFNLQSEEAENPLTLDPQVREDVVLTDNITVNSEVAAEEEPENNVITRARVSDSSALGFSSGILASSASNPDLIINKSGLNFRQIHLSDDEREQLNKLKERIKSLWGNPSSN
jgi:hypothetical protein